MNTLLHAGHEHTEAAAAAGPGFEAMFAGAIGIVGLAIVSAYVMKRYHGE